MSLSFDDTVELCSSSSLCLPLVGVVGEKRHLGSVVELVVVYFPGDRTQQREERGSTAQEHQEARHRDLLQR